MRSKSDSQDELRTAQRRFIERAKALDPQQRSISQIARDGGLNHTTLTQFMKPGSKRVLELLTIRRVEEVTGVKAPPDITGAPVFSEETEPFRLAPDADTQTLLDVLIGGRNGVTHMTVASRALELAGYLPGDIAIIDLNNLNPEPGDAVYAQVYDWDKMRARTVFRQFKRAAPVNLLVSQTLHPGLQDVFVVDGERVAIKGVVTDVLRRHLRSQAA
jgi:hypothetical protein